MKYASLLAEYLADKITQEDADVALVKDPAKATEFGAAYLKLQETMYVAKVATPLLDWYNDSIEVFIYNREGVYVINDGGKIAADIFLSDDSEDNCYRKIRNICRVWDVKMEKTDDEEIMFYAAVGHEDEIAPAIWRVANAINEASHLLYSQAPCRYNM